MGRRRFLHVCIGWTAVVNLICSNAHRFPSSGGQSGSRRTSHHICEVPYGREPNFEGADDCSSYWQCGDHGATLQYCDGSDQFHFQYGKCMNDEDVSCWVQMEKYVHGYSYSRQLRNQGYSNSKSCTFTKGQEPNYFDEGCQTYWYCEDHQGTLYECPDGFQFHWGKLDCMWDEEVFCEKQMEYFYEHVLYKMVHTEEGDHTTAAIDDAYTATYAATATADAADAAAATADFTTESVTGLPRRHQNRRNYRCDVEVGREPDYDSEDCETFWRCRGYRGLPQKCPEGYLFHWGDKECLKDIYVDCQKQREFADRLHP